MGVHMNASGPETGQQAGKRAWVMSQAGLQDLAGNNFHVDKMSFKKQHPMLDQTGLVDTLSYCHRPVPTHPLLAFLLSQASFRSGTVQALVSKYKKPVFTVTCLQKARAPAVGSRPSVVLGAALCSSGQQPALAQHGRQPGS